MSHRFTFPVPTDHAPGGWHHGYMEVYEKLFAPMKAKDSNEEHKLERAIRLLEIGTDGGGGLRSYQEYFQYARILGVDISPTPDSCKGQPRITHFQLDAYTLQTVRGFQLEFEELDIIIDDGSHQLGHQEFFAKHYPSLLSPNGVAVIEDIAEHAHLVALQSAVGPEFFTMGIDLTHHDNRRFDNRLLAIWRR